MATNPVSLKRLALLLTTCLLAGALAGCVGDDDDPAPVDTGGDAGDGDATGANGDGSGGDAAGGDDMDGSGADTPDPADPGDVPAEECAPVFDPLANADVAAPALPDPTTWDPTTWDPTTMDPAELVSYTETKTFTVAEGTMSLLATSYAGPHVTPGWAITILDPSGSEAYAFTSGPNADPAADIIHSGTVNAPTPGTWTIDLRVAGYVDGFGISVEGETCI